MRSNILAEAKANLECGIAKSLESAPLTIEEVVELEGMSAVDLVSEHGLDIAMAQVVISHAANESSRLRNQELMTREKIEEKIRRKLRNFL